VIDCLQITKEIQLVIPTPGNNILKKASEPIYSGKTILTKNCTGKYIAIKKYINPRILLMFNP
ncbi:hypothetical protein, partial [Limosilactobacillus pontis]|uniref:hypothetical protein n=1 Tax=Limosilactobacillus pontis TaxID=35787 RepID=UPI002F2618A2